VVINNVYFCKINEIHYVLVLCCAVILVYYGGVQQGLHDLYSGYMTIILRSIVCLIQ